MLKEVQVNKEEDKVYAMDEEYNVIAEYEMSKDFWPGENSAGEEFCNAQKGKYDLTDQEVDADGPYSNDGTRDLARDVLPYGWGYINIDARGHALHGGGSNLGWPDSDAPRQELTKTQGCFRMYNEDVFELAKMILKARSSGIKVELTVV